jgi:hypothetical protein
MPTITKEELAMSKFASEKPEMTNPVKELRIRAEILHTRVAAAEPESLTRLRALPVFRRRTAEQLTGVATKISRRDCLAVIATEHGFDTWLDAKRALSPEPSEVEVADFGTLLWSNVSGGHINRWYKTHAEAAAVRQETGGYLLAHKRHFVVVDRHFIQESLGLNPDDHDWVELGFDWARPKSVAARARLYAKVLAAFSKERAN